MKAVNLLPPDLRGAAKAPAPLGAGADAPSGPAPFIALGLLAAAVVAVAGYVLAGNQLKQREADLVEVTARQQVVAAQVAELKPYADFDALASERVSTVTDLAGSRFDWEQALRDLSRAIPASVTLESLSGNVSTDAGGAGSSLRGAIAAPAITLKGCTRSQREVPALMSRLRGVDGVTRVSLARSEEQIVAEAPAAPVVPAGGEIAAQDTAPCGAGRRPDFELVMFFEGDAGASAAPSAQPAAPGDPGQPGGEEPPADGAEPPADGEPAAAEGTATPASTQEGATP